MTLYWDIYWCKFGQTVGIARQRFQRMRTKDARARMGTIDIVDLNRELRSEGRGARRKGCVLFRAPCVLSRLRVSRHPFLRAPRLPLLK